MEITCGKYLISTEKSKLSLDTVYDFLINKSYWARYRTREQIEMSINNSLCFGAYDEGVQVGFARVVTDYSVMYWLCDVFVNEEYRGQSIGKLLVESVVNHPDLKDLNGILATRDAQSLYEKYGFEIPSPETVTYMRKRKVPLFPA